MANDNIKTGKTSSKQANELLSGYRLYLTYDLNLRNVKQITNDHFY